MLGLDEEAVGPAHMAVLVEVLGGEVVVFLKRHVLVEAQRVVLDVAHQEIPDDEEVRRGRGLLERKAVVAVGVGTPKLSVGGGHDVKQVVGGSHRRHAPSGGFPCARVGDVDVGGADVFGGVLHDLDAGNVV